MRCFALFILWCQLLSASSNKIFNQNWFIVPCGSQYDACLQTAPTGSTSVGLCAFLCGVM